jgi:hypothetical protein
VSGGPRTFKLPAQADVVFDLYRNRELARDATQFCVELPPASTSLFYTGPADRLSPLNTEPKGP